MTAFTLEVRASSPRERAGQAYVPSTLTVVIGGLLVAAAMLYAALVRT